jgi:uncharacterized protein (TIGR02001 family)
MLALSVGLGCFASGAMANDLTFSYGVDITSNYISKGSTQTEDRPAVQPYLEVGLGLFYASLWASNVRFGGVSDIELDVGAGIRPSWGDVDFDIGFVRYLYRDDDNNYGEATIKADWAATDQVSVGLDYYREVYADTDWLYFNGTLTELPWGLSLSGGVGSDLGSRDLGSNKYAADIGLSRDLGPNMSADLRVYGGNFDDEVLVFTLSFFN